MKARYFLLFGGALFGLAAAVQGAEWTWRAPIGGNNGNSIFGAAYSPERQRVLAVDLGGNVLTKTGPGPWQISRLPGLIGLESAHWTGRHFIIRGEDDRATVRPGGWVAVSKNGIGWKPINALRGRWLVREFASSPDVTVAIAASLTFRQGLPAGPIIFFSEDPARAVWKRATLPAADLAQSPAFSGSVAYANNRFAALLDNGAVLTSIDGKKWARQPAPLALSHSSPVLANADLFAVQGGDGIYTSTDGAVWNLADLPQELSYVSKLIATGRGFLAVRFWEAAFYTEDFKTWEQLSGDDWSWLLSAASDESGGLYLFGSGGRIKYRAPSATLETMADPGGLGGDFGMPLRFFAGFNGSFFAADGEGEQSFSLSGPGRWQPISGGLDVPGRPRPRSFHQVAGGVLAVAGDSDVSLYLYEGAAWRLLGPAPAMDDTWQIISAALSPQGRALALARARSPGGSALRYRFYLSDADLREWQLVHEAESPGELDAEDRVEHDGERFLAVINPGRLLSSANGEEWTQLPPIPDDSPALRRAYYGNYAVPAANEPRSFASNGQILVAASSKLEYSTDGQMLEVGSNDAVQQLFTYSFATGRWRSVVPPGDNRVAFSYPAVVRWNGSLFIAAARDGSLLSADYEGGSVHTSVDGYQWTKRDFPVGGNLLDLVWTGSEFAAVTFGSSVLTHPGNISSFADPPDVRDRVIFPHMAPKIFGSAPFSLRERSASGRTQVYDIDGASAGVAVVEGNEVTITGVGRASIEASVPESPLAPPVERTLNVRPLQQRLAIIASPRPTRDLPFQILLRSNSDASPQFTSQPPGALDIESVGPASPDGSSFVRTCTAVARGAGRVELTVRQSGDANRLASKAARLVLTVQP